MSDHWNAYVREDFEIQPTGEGRLQGLNFAVKDVFAIQGWTNTSGNPDWHRSHGPATDNAVVIEELLKRGAKLRGITHTDELMYSLNGENFFYGTPVNPAAPDRIPGGSSSGSAVAAAAGLADFALGTDTGGSVRVPASYCGVHGFRPSHGLIPLRGVIPLSPSFDTAGWMSRDSGVMLDVGLSLMPRLATAGLQGPRLHYMKEAWDLADAPCRAALAESLPLWESAAQRSDWIEAAPEGLPSLYHTFRTIQGYEIWQSHGDWIRKEHPRFGPDIAERFAWTRTLSREDYEKQLAVRREIRERVEGILADGDLLVLPTVPSGAPMRGMTGAAGDRIRAAVMQLSCVAGITGLPQVTVPAGMANGVPAGISFIAGSGQDLRLLRWVHEVTTNADLQRQVGGRE
jgi:amidase